MPLVDRTDRAAAAMAGCHPHRVTVVEILLRGIVIACGRGKVGHIAQVAVQAPALAAFVIAVGELHRITGDQGPGSAGGAGIGRRADRAAQRTRVEDDVATGADRAGVGDVGRHRIAHFIERGGDAYRYRNADRAGSRPGDRGRAGVGRDAGGVARGEQDIAGADAAGTVDIRMHQGAHPVFHPDPGAAQGQADRARCSDGDRAGVGACVDRTFRTGVEREVAAGVDAGVGNGGLHLRCVRQGLRQHQLPQADVAKILAGQAGDALEAPLLLVRVVGRGEVDAGAIALLVAFPHVDVVADLDADLLVVGVGEGLRVAGVGVVVDLLGRRPDVAVDVAAAHTLKHLDGGADGNRLQQLRAGEGAGGRRRIPADEVARQREAHRGADAGRAADRHRTAGGDDPRVDGRIAERIEVDLAAACDHAAGADKGVGAGEDDVLGGGAGAADGNAGGAATADGERRRGGKRLDRGQALRIDDDIAGGVDMGAVNARLDRVAYVVLAQRHAHREGHAGGATEGCGDRGGSGHGVDGGGVGSVQGHVKGADARRRGGAARMVAVDYGLDVAGDLVGGRDPGAREPDADLAAGGDRHRTCQHHRVDRLRGLCVDCQVAGQDNARIPHLGLHLRRRARAACVPADQVFGDGYADRCAHPGLAAAAQRHRSRGHGGVDGRQALRIDIQVGGGEAAVVDVGFGGCEDDVAGLGARAADRHADLVADAEGERGGRRARGDGAVGQFPQLGVGIVGRAEVAGIRRDQLPRAALEVLLAQVEVGIVALVAIHLVADLHGVAGVDGQFRRVGGVVVGDEAAVAVDPPGAAAVGITGCHTHRVTGVKCRAAAARCVVRIGKRGGQHARLDGDAAGGAQLVGILHIGFDGVAHFIGGQRHRDRKADAQLGGADRGRHRGGASVGIDGRVVGRRKRHAAGMDAGGAIAVDIGPHMFVDAVFRHRAGAGQAQRALAYRDGDRGRADGGLNVLVRRSREGQRAGGADTGVFCVGHDLAGLLDAVFPADQVARPHRADGRCRNRRGHHGGVDFGAVGGGQRDARAALDHASLEPGVGLAENDVAGIRTATAQGTRIAALGDADRHRAGGSDTVDLDGIGGAQPDTAGAGRQTAVDGIGEHTGVDGVVGQRNAEAQGAGAAGPAAGRHRD